MPSFSMSSASLSTSRTGSFAEGGSRAGGPQTGSAAPLRAPHRPRAAPGGIAVGSFVITTRHTRLRGTEARRKPRAHTQRALRVAGLRDRREFRPGQQIHLRPESDAVHLFDPSSGARIG